MATDRGRREAEGRLRPPEENGSVLPAAPAPPAGCPPSPSAGNPPPPPDYDGWVLPALGGLSGSRQRRLVLLTWLPALFIGFSQFSDNFLLDLPDYTCRGAGDNGSRLHPSPAPREAGGNGSGWRPALLLLSPLPNSSRDDCQCQQWDYRIRAGLSQNVVSKNLNTMCLGDTELMTRKVL